MHLTAAAGQCASEYITTGVIYQRLYFNDFDYPDTSPIWGCESPPNNDTRLCVTGRQAFSYSGATDGVTAPTSSNYSMQSDPVTEPWRFKFAYFQLTLDAAYNDGKGMQKCTAMHGCICRNVLDPRVCNGLSPYSALQGTPGKGRVAVTLVPYLVAKDPSHRSWDMAWGWQSDHCLAGYHACCSLFSLQSVVSKCGSSTRPRCCRTSAT